MRQFISVCKNMIAQNNKNGWVDPAPTIRVANSKSGKVVNRSNRIGVLDREGNVVAELIATNDGKPVISCGAKVALITNYETVDLTDKGE